MMIRQGDRMKAAGLAIAVMSLLLSPFCLAASAEGETKASTAKLTQAEIMVNRIGKGINLDVSQLEGGSPIKVLYNPAQYDAVKAAGFQSVRFFVGAGEDPAIYKTRIEDALDRDLAVVICLWGSGQWALKPKEGIQEFVRVWDRIAKCYHDYPDGLIFELWNEPAGLIVNPGEPQGLKDGKTVMRYLNSAIPIIRKTNPGRTLAIGGPGFNGGRELGEFVSPEYLTYKLEDGTGFEDDTNLIGIIHMYHPHKFTHWTSGLDEAPGWKDEMRAQMSHSVAWSKRWRKPLVLSEFGAWAPPCHSVEDFKAYIRFVTDECKKHNIGWMYYCAGFNNQWAFNILHTEDGWNQDALDVLTGVTAPPVPPMSPLINTEFGWSTANWSSEGSVKISVARSAGLSGPTALKVEVTKSDRAEVYQETPHGKGSPPGRYLISVRKGKLYRISFLAKSVSGTGTVKVRLASVSGSGDGFWTSMPVRISGAGREYTVEYLHTSEEVDDVRVAFLFGDHDQTVLLDRIALRGYRGHAIPRAVDSRGTLREPNVGIAERSTTMRAVHQPKEGERVIADFEGGDPAAMINTTHKANVTVFRDPPQGGGKLAAKTVVDEAAGAVDYFGTGFGFPALDLSDSAEIRIWIKTDIESAFNLQIHSDDNRASVFRFSTVGSDPETWKQITAPVASFTMPPWSRGKADWTRVNNVQITAFGSGPYDGKYIIIDNVICAGNVHRPVRPGRRQQRSRTAR